MRNFARLTMATLTLITTQQTFAALSKVETETLKEYIKIYKESKTFHQLARRTHFHAGFTTDQALEVMGSHYTATLPKISYDLEKGTLSFRVNEGSQNKTINVQFTSLEKGEMVINGREFKIDPRISGLENAVLLQKTLTTKSASFLDFFTRPALAQEFVQDIQYREYESASISKLRSTTLMGLLDNPAVVGAGSVTAGSVVGSLLAIGGGWAGAVAGVGALPGHWGVKKFHALIAPSCEEQAAQIASELLKMKQAMIGLNCAISGDSSIKFSQGGGKSETLYANWERSDAYFQRHGPLYIFDRDKLTEVRRVEDVKDFYDKSKGEKSGWTGKVKKYVSGEYFDQRRNDIEPYRRILHIMGKYESCYKCEKFFHEQLVFNVDGNGDFNTREFRMPEAIRTYEILQKAAKREDRPDKTER